jgi:hypothetical protein
MNRFLFALLCCFPILVSANRSGDKQGTLCSLFTTAEIKAQFGTPVEGGEMAGLGTGCQWAAINNDTAFAMIGVIADTSAWSNPIAAPSYQKVTGINGEGFSVKDPQGGWRAEARNGKGAYAVLLIGAPSASREGAVALLRKLLERR